MRTLVTSGSNLGIQGLVRVGATLQQVRNGLPQNLERGVNTGVAAGPALGAAGFILETLGLPVYGVVYCPQRIGLVFRDGNADTGAGVLSADDVVIRVTLREGFTGATDTGIALGDTRAEVHNAHGTAQGYAQGATWPGRSSDIYPARGVTFVESGASPTSVVESISVYSPLSPMESLQPTPANAPVSLDPARLGTQQRGVTAAIIGGTPFGTVPTRMGNPDVAGRLDINGTTLNYQAWLQAGVLVVAGDPVLNQQPVVTTILIPPYGGRFTSSNGTALGVGSSRAEWNAAGLMDNGVVMLGNVPVQRYRVTDNFGATNTGVIFAQHRDCSDRAVALVLNYVGN